MKNQDFQPSSRAYTRTDLACEAGRLETGRAERSIPIAEGDVRILESTECDGRRYVTITTPKLTHLGEHSKADLAHILADCLKAMAERMLGQAVTSETRVLVAGFGNPDMTPDAIGPYTVRGLTATRHLRTHDEGLYGALGCCELSAVSPLVLGQTGIESGEVVRGVVAHVNPHLIVAIDALAARSCDRLACTIQLSDGGIGPGSGVGNHRMSIDQNSMGCPVLALGVPTVVDSSTLVYDALSQADISEEDISPKLKEVLETGRSFVVSPKDSDIITQVTTEVLSRALDMAFGVGEM